MTLDQWRARYEGLCVEAARLRAERDAARAEAAELQSLFDLQRKRMDAARALWQQAHPDKENVWPDLGDLLAWLMQEWDAALKENSQLRLVLATSNAKCAYCGLPAEEMAKCASGFPGCARGDDMLSGNTPTRQELVAELEAAKADAERYREERNALQETITACENEVAEVYDFATHGKFAKMTTAAAVIIDEINKERRKLEDERDVARAERDAAEAEVARAAETLRKLSERVAVSAKLSFGSCNEWLDSFRLNFPDECAAYEEAVAVLSASQPALDWFAKIKREAITPEPISEKHKDGNWWLVWNGDTWYKCKWETIEGAWRQNSGQWLYSDPTHALPMPPAPEGE